MKKSRLEAYTDAVIAIIITLMVLELKVPTHGDTFASLAIAGHDFLVYVISFFLLSMYWNNHHHLLQSVENVSGAVLWCNNLFIFSLTMVPFSTNWLAENLWSRDPNLLYGFVILMADFAYYLLIHFLKKSNGGKQSVLENVYGQSRKMQITLGTNIIALLLGFIQPVLVLVVNLIVIVVLWFVPERRVERLFNGK